MTKLTRCNLHMTFQRDCYRLPYIIVNRTEYVTELITFVYFIVYERVEIAHVEP